MSLQHAVELKPDYPEARYNLAHALATLGDGGAAMIQLREALRVRPNWPQALASLADLEAAARNAAAHDPAPSLK